MTKGEVIATKIIAAAHVFLLPAVVPMLGYILWDQYMLHGAEAALFLGTMLVGFFLIPMLYMFQWYGAACRYLFLNR
jgi:membrane protein YdbS with pleckstrin-like domain